MKDNKWNASLYDDKHAFVSSYGNELLGILDPKPGMKVLDLGCGTGKLTSEIQHFGCTVTGMDFSNDMINLAREKYPNVKFVVGDASDFDLGEPFDAVFSNACLHWVKNKEGAAMSMYKALKPGGKIVAELGGKDNVQIIVGTLKDVLKTKGYVAEAEADPWYFPSVGEYASVLEKAGFKVIFAHHFDRPTELADEGTGIKDWLSMFGNTFFQGIPEADREQIKQEVQELLKPFCFKNGKWYADYKRLRIVAEKPTGSL